MRRIAPSTLSHSIRVTSGILVSYGAMRIVILIAALALAVNAGAQPTAFVGGRVIDGTGRAIENGVVIIDGGKITAVGPASTPVPAGATRVDLKGKTILPGLVNAHGHVAATTGLRTDQASVHARQSAAAAAHLRHVRRDHGLQPWRRSGGRLRAAQRECGRGRSGAPVRGGSGDYRRHRRCGTRDDQQGRRHETRPVEDPRRRQSRHRSQDAGGGVARGRSTRHARASSRSRSTSTGSPTRKRRCWPAPT